MAVADVPAGPQSFLAYRRFRHLKLALFGLVACTALYVWDDPVGGRNGGTWTGWGLGTLATLLILWLLWFGVRKRSYFSSGAPLQGWLSAHVYLGISLLLLVPLHSGFEFHWNFHNLVYALIVMVVLSGILGITLYASVPAAMTRNRRGQKIDGLFEQVADLDTECSGVALGLPDFYARAVDVAINETRIGGSWRRQFSALDPNCGTARSLAMIAEHQQDLRDEDRANVARLVELLGRKSVLLERIRRDVRYQALLEVWLFFHVPLSFAALASVGVHIFVVFYYW
jgi:hypothetical protein